MQDIVQSSGQEAAGLVVPSRGRRPVGLSHVDGGQARFFESFEWNLAPHEIQVTSQNHSVRLSKFFGDGVTQFLCFTDSFGVFFGPISAAALQVGGNQCDGPRVGPNGRGRRSIGGHRGQSWD